jgi:ABC-type polysaccharide/polyol phosphate transport system ATPase subunit
MNSTINSSLRSPGNEPNKVLSAKNIQKFFTDPVSIQVLKDINFEVNAGEFVSSKYHGHPIRWGTLVDEQ